MLHTSFTQFFIQYKDRFNRFKEFQYRYGQSSGKEKKVSVRKKTNIVKVL